VGIDPKLKVWLNNASNKLTPSHPVYAELKRIEKQYTLLSHASNARYQIAMFYKQWFDSIAASPKTGRSMALFQDLSAAYALGKSLPDLTHEGTARRPEAVAEPLMLSCL
jgi:hypothetical protein